MRRPDFGVEARSDESAGRVEAKPGKLLRLLVRSPVGLTATGDRSSFLNVRCDPLRGLR